MQLGRLSIHFPGHHGRKQPVLITEAEPSQNEQLGMRRRRYIITMTFRVVLLVLAASFYRIPWLMAILAGLALILPWIAVIMANDRPAPKGEKVSHYLHLPRAGLPRGAPPSVGHTEHPYSLTTPLLEDHQSQQANATRDQPSK